MVIKNLLEKCKNVLKQSQDQQKVKDSIALIHSAFQLMKQVVFTAGNEDFNQIASSPITSFCYEILIQTLKLSSTCLEFSPRPSLVFTLAFS